MPDFPANPRPDYPVQETVIEPDVLISKHKDGSEQRRLKGAGRKRIFRLQFGGSMPLTNTQREALETHYSGQNGKLTAFDWTHPERATVYVVRYEEGPKFEHAGYNAYTANLTLTEVPA